MNLDDDVYEAALDRARATGWPLGRVLSDMARQSLESVPRVPLSRADAGRFATFDTPRDAPVIPASRIQQALDDGW